MDTQRDHHRELDGQIRDVDDDFEVGGMTVEAPGMFGDPAEDCNCRCCLLQRARWELDESELDTLRGVLTILDWTRRRILMISRSNT